MKKVLFIFTVFLILFLVIVFYTFQYSRSWENAFFIDPFYIIETNEKLVALTFDDGPSATRTLPLLDLLEKNNIEATFFKLGENIEKYPDIAMEVYKKGHLIGNHSYDHPRLIFRSPSFIKEQIAKTDQLIKLTGQKNVQYFRPPYSSKYLILPLVLKSMNKILVTGTYDPPSQYTLPYNAEKIAKEVIENIKPGSIVYLHDGRDDYHEEFIRSVGLIISGLRAKGYRFIRLDYQP